jgi:hypothetical protein
MAGAVSDGTPDTLECRDPEPPLNSKLTLVARLFVEPGRAVDFERFESAASEIMRRHGGTLEAMREPRPAPEEASMYPESARWLPSTVLPTHPSGTFLIAPPDGTLRPSG